MNLIITDLALKRNNKFCKMLLLPLVIHKKIPQNIAKKIPQKLFFSAYCKVQIHTEYINPVHAKLSDGFKASVRESKSWIENGKIRQMKQSFFFKLWILYTSIKQTL